MTLLNKQYHQTSSLIEEEYEQIKRAKKDPKYFSVLYDKYYISIFRFVFKRIGDEDDAADLTSQVFIKAINNLPGYEFRGVPFSAWLHQIARNEVNLAFRKIKYNRVVDVKTENLCQIIEECEEEENEEQIEKLLEALRKLDSEDLELLEMRYFEKRPFKEICEILAIKESNAKVKMHRILKKLKAILLESKSFEP